MVQIHPLPAVVRCNEFNHLEGRIPELMKYIQTSVGPYMDQAMPVASINLIAFFIIEESSNVFQGFCNRAPNPRGRGMTSFF